jgi:hypothetical protein
MISITKGDFWRCFNALDPRIQKLAAEAYEMFKDNPGHPSLRFKKLAGMESVWTVRVNSDVRAAGIRKGDTIEWFWIGHHKEFDHLFG